MTREEKLVAQVERLRALLIEGVPHLAVASDEYEDFMGMRCTCCYAVLDTYDKKKHPLTPHLPDCWAAKVAKELKMSARKLDRGPVVRPTFPWDTITKEGV